MVLSREERDQILGLLNSCSADDFKFLVETYVYKIELIHWYSSGKGYLVLKGTSKRNFYIQISGKSDWDLKMLTFVHEVFHLPLIIKGHQPETEEEQRKLVEDKIDAAAKLFFEREPELVEHYYWLL